MGKKRVKFLLGPRYKLARIVLSPIQVFFASKSRNQRIILNCRPKKSLILKQDYLPGMDLGLVRSKASSPQGKKQIKPQRKKQIKSQGKKQIKPQRKKQIKSQ